MSELKQSVEAILFAAARTVSLQELCKLCRIRDPAIIQQTVEQLKQDLKERNSPLLITAETDGWKMTVGEKHLSTVREITPHTELSKALLETLAVIAWKQPILQSDVIKIRTSGAYEHIAELLKLGFINKTKQGRSYALKVTGKFFEYFDLPGHEALKMEFEKIQGTAEMQKILGDQTKLGELPVYQVPPDQQPQPSHAEGGEENVGGLEVYDSTGAQSAPQPKLEEPSEEELRTVLTAAHESPALEIDEPRDAESDTETPAAQESGADASESEESTESEELADPEEPEKAPDGKRKLSAQLESFAEEGKGEWGKGKESDAEAKSKLDDKL